METTISPNSVGHGWSRAVRIGAVIQIIALWQSPEGPPLARIGYDILVDTMDIPSDISLILFIVALPLMVILPVALATSVAAPFYSGNAAWAFSVGSVLWVAYNGVLEKFFVKYGEIYSGGLMSAHLVYLLSAGLCAAQCRHVPRESRPFWLFLPPIVLALLGWVNFAIGILFMPPISKPWFSIALVGCLASVVILIGWLGWWRTYSKARKAAPDSPLRHS